MNEKRTINLQLAKAGASAVLSALGSSIFLYALSLKLLEITGSAFGYGTSLFIGPIVGVLVAPFIGGLIDRFDHKIVALWSKLGLIITMILLSIIYKYTLKANFYLVAVVFVCTINIFSRLFSIAYLSSTEQIVGRDKMQQLNSIQTTGVAIANIVSAPIAGFIYGQITFGMIVLFEIIMEICTFFLTWRTSFTKLHNSDLKKGTKSDRRSAVKIVSSNRELLFLLLEAMVLNFAIISLQIGIPFVIIKVLKESALLSGNIQGIFSLGVFIGGIVISLYKVKSILIFTKKVYALTGKCLFLFGILLFFFSQSAIIIFGVFELIFGFFNAIADPPLFTYIQKTISQENLGKVNTLVYTSAQLLSPLAILLYSLMFNELSYKLVYLLNGIMMYCLLISIESVGKILKEEN